MRPETEHLNPVLPAGFLMLVRWSYDARRSMIPKGGDFFTDAIWRRLIAMR
jgi:hypothetical protein